ncbi:DUF4229 domain-containing protein [Streptomyces sp. BI20]|uniref:DUF4229 domain-containing protein n=1 Tax=Streptomyces sp. BI20 TaxID=3403460 RepID=UPI003C746689
MSLKSNATLRYSALRIGIFVACFGLVWGLMALGVIPMAANQGNLAWVLMLAIVISAPLSFVLLRKQRDEMSEVISDRVSSAKGRLKASQGQEDVADDAARTKA